MNHLRCFLCLTIFAVLTFPFSAFLESVVAHTQEAPLLELNNPIERTIAEGETHSYRIRLNAGDYAHIGGEGKDSVGKNFYLSSKVFAPDGRQVYEIGKLAGFPFGVKPVSLIAETSGDYLLQVRSIEKSGTYQIVLDILRPAMLQDRSRAKAEAAFIQADAFYQKERKEDLQQAVEILRASLPDWRAAEMPLAEADALTIFGLSYKRLGETQQAVEQYQLAFDIYKRQNWDIGGALMLNNIGVAYSDAGDKATAIQYYLPLTELWRQFNNSIMYGMAMTNLGSLYGSVGEFRKGVETLQEALGVWERQGDRKWKFSTVNKLATTYSGLGEYELAADFSQQALEQWRESDGLYEKAQRLMGVGKAQADLSNYPKAIEAQFEAFKLCQQVGNDNCRVAAVSGLGVTYFVMKDYPRAAQCFQQALDISRASNNLYNEAKMLSSLGRVQAIFNELPTAERLLLQSLTLQQFAGDKLAEAHARGGLARVYRDQGRLDESIASMQTALSLIEQQRQALSGHASQSSYFSRLHEYHEFYLDLLIRLHNQSPSGNYAVAAFEASEQARARSLLEALSGTRSDIRQGVDAELLQRETAIRQQLFYKEQVLVALLNGKNSAERLAAAQKEIEALLTQKREVEALIRARNPRYAALIQPESLGLKEIQQQVLDENTVLLEYALGGERSFLFAVTKTSFDVYELPKRDEIEALAKRFYDIAARRPPEFTAINEWLPKAEKEFPAIAADLSRMLLLPAAAHLGKKRVMIVAEGILQYLPFAALPMPLNSKLFGQNHELINLPSASVLAVLRRETAQRKPAPKTLAVLGDPVFSMQDGRLAAQPKTFLEKSKATTGDLKTLRRELMRGANNLAELANLTRLEHTRQEAMAIASLVDAKSKLLALGFDANRELAIGDKLSQYRIVHFATHGWMDAQTPDLSAVVLSLVDKTGKPQNGLLRLHEIYNLNLPAELVVLSACETGLGKDIKGEGLISLTRGFFYAGARRVLVSLWPVDDPATAELMKRFYRGMLKEKLNPAAALKQAQLEMRTRTQWRSPYYWAGFTLQGEW